jgi:hypothetical protein
MFCLKKVGPKRARVAVARKLAVRARMWKDGAHLSAHQASAYSRHVVEAGDQNEFAGIVADGGEE